MRSQAVGDVDTMVFSPDGTRLAVVGLDGTLRLWHLSTGALRTLRAGHDQPLRAVAFAPDGRTLAVVAIEDDGDRVTLLDTTTGRAQRTIEPGARSPLSLAFSPDGHTLATVSTGNGAGETWDTRTGSRQAAGNSLNRTVRNGRRQPRRAARHYDPWAWTGSSAS
ncbi:WD40 repeat domain-containing protein [Streptomyces sp. RK62]|uniref:WD40 repeat domain-containing protein n=1 Tax=Streptomyces sp. RK62 TaxID=2824893 RepID=UPI001FFC6669|nr:WD40 repeat domain-containing protein [Streptomyces sp. RK62]